MFEDPVFNPGGGGLVSKSCPTLATTDCGLQVRGISQAGILEWVASSFSRRPSRPRDWSCISWLAGRFFSTEPPGKPIFVLGWLWILAGWSWGTWVVTGGRKRGYLSRWPQHPRGCRSCAPTSPSGHTAPGSAPPRRTACCPGRCLQSPGRSGPSRRQTWPDRTPAAGTRPQLHSGPTGRHTRCPRPPHAGPPRVLSTVLSHPPAAAPASPLQTETGWA